MAVLRTVSFELGSDILQINLFALKCENCGNFVQISSQIVVKPNKSTHQIDITMTISPEARCLSLCSVHRMAGQCGGAAS